MTDSQYDNIILHHYKKVAKNFGLGGNSTIEDPYVREKEIQFITEEIQRYHLERRQPLTILDAGCGNAYTLSQLQSRFHDFSFIGVEFTPELFELAKQRELERVKIVQGDLRIPSFVDGFFDVIITERVIINILNREDQEKAVANLIGKLKNDGLFIMIESFQEPLLEVNQARAEMCLEPLKESYQNKYLNEMFIKRVLKYGLTEITPVMPCNFLSTHFYLTRVLHKILRPEGGKVKFTKMVDFFNKALPAGVGNFSPVLFRSFKKFFSAE